MSTVQPAPDGQQDSPLHQADQTAAFRFLDFIFDGGGNGFAEFQYFSSGRRPKKIDQPTYLNLPLDHEQVLNEVLKRNGQRMITVGLAPRCRIPDKGRAGRNQDVLQVGSIWANLDNARARGGAIDVISRIQDFPLRPSVVVNSGYGYHVYFMFHEQIRAGELLVWSALIRDLRVALHADIRTNLCEVMRLPGTLNIKESHPVACDISEEYSSWTRYSLEEVRKAINASSAHQPSVMPVLSIESLQLNESKDRAVIGEAWQDNEDGFLENVLPPGYVLKDGSIWFNPPVLDAGKKLPKPMKVSNSFIRISEIQENIDTGEISLLIAFYYLDKTRSVPIQRSEMADSRKLVSALAGAGAPVTSNNARLVTAYLAAYEHSFTSSIPHKQVTSRFGRGRTGGPFFLPGLSSIVEFAPSGQGDAALYRAYSSRSGTLAGWLGVMRVLADESLMIPQVAVMASLIPPLQRKLWIPNFILDIYGNSSTGKSTTLKLAASVYGRPHDPDSLVLQWMNTQVAVEQIAGLCSELPIYLDDAQHCPAELKRSIVYIIANGRGKGRGGRGGMREISYWHTVALSSSEEPLHESSPHEGARGRILAIGGLTRPFRSGMGSLVYSLERAVADNHGYAGEVYIRHLNGWTEADWSRWQKRYLNIRAELLKNSSTDLVGRVSGYIAAVQLAAEISCPLLGLAFKPDVIGSWLMIHLSEQQSDQNMILLALRELSDFYVAHVHHFAGDGRYERASRVAIFGISKNQKYIGFLRSTIDAVFKGKRWNVMVILNKLAEAGALHATEEARHTKKVSIEGIQHRLVCVKWSAIFSNNADQ